MPDHWIIRVAGKEYGPVDLEVLREWKREGRLLSANEARLESESQWSNAGAIPGLFQSLPLAPSQSEAKRSSSRGVSFSAERFRSMAEDFSVPGSKWAGNSSLALWAIGECFR